MVLNLWQFFLPGDVWQSPKTFSVITLGMSWGVRDVATEIWWVEARMSHLPQKFFWVTEGHTLITKEPRFSNIGDEENFIWRE